MIKRWIIIAAKNTINALYHVRRDIRRFAVGNLIARNCRDLKNKFVDDDLVCVNIHVKKREREKDTEKSCEFKNEVALDSENVRGLIAGYDVMVNKSQHKPWIISQVVRISALNYFSCDWSFHGLKVVLMLPTILKLKYDGKINEQLLLS